MGLGSGTGHIRLGPGPWAMIPSRQSPGMVLKRPVLLSFPHPHWYRHLRHAVCLGCCSSWNYMLCGCCSRSVFPFPSLLSASAWYRTAWVLKIAVAVAAGESLLQPLQRNTRFLPGTFFGTQNCWAAVPAGCANEFQTMLWGCSSRHSKVGSISCIFECWAAVPAGYDIYNNGYLFCSSSKAAVGPRASLRKRRAHAAGIFGPKCC